MIPNTSLELPPGLAEPKLTPEPPRNIPPRFWNCVISYI